MTADQVAPAIGDVKTFELQARRCTGLGIDVSDFPIGHPVDELAGPYAVR